MIVSAQGVVSVRCDDRPVVRELASRQQAAAGTQEDQHRRGEGLLLRLALLSGRRRGPGDLLRRRAFRPSVVPLLRLGAANVDVGADHGTAQVPGNGVHRTAVHRRRDVPVQLPQQGGAPRPTRSGDRQVRVGLRAQPPDRHRLQQKVFFEIVKQFQGEYMGSLLSGLLRVDGCASSSDDEDDMDSTMALDSGWPVRSTTTTASSRRNSG